MSQLSRGEKALFIMPAEALSPPQGAGSGSSSAAVALPALPSKALQAEVELQLLSFVQVRKGRIWDCPSNTGEHAKGRVEGDAGAGERRFVRGGCDAHGPRGGRVVKGSSSICSDALCLWPSAQVRDVTGTGEVTKKRVTEGTGEFPIDCPLNDTTVRAHYRVRVTKAGTPGPWLFDTRKQRLQQAAEGSNRGQQQEQASDGELPPLEFDTGER